MTAFITNDQGRRARRAKRHRRRLHPSVMALEGRTLLSTIVVDNPTDKPVPGQTDLRQAIAQANSDGGGDTIVFSSLFNTPQTITLTGGQLELTGKAATTIKGPGANLLTISGHNNSRIFELAPSSVATVSGLTITAGYAYNGYGGGVLNDGADLTLTGVIVSGSSVYGANISPYGGGGIAAPGDGGTTTLVDCTVAGNAVSAFRDSDSFGGGIYNGLFNTLTMIDCAITGNSCYGGGGGIWSEGGTTLTVTGCTINNNSSGDNGDGGGVATSGSRANLTDDTISGNTAGYGGGVSAADEPLLAMTGCTVSGNTAVSRGGGVYSQFGDTTLTKCTVSDNSTTGSGGGVINLGSTETLSNCTVSGNSAGVNGGGLFNGFPPSFAKSHATLAGRSVGGANYDTPMSLTNCTVSGNSAYGANIAPFGGGGMANYGTLSLTNTIVAGNTGGDVGGDYTGSNNLIGGNPLLSALGDYGGPTATIALLPGSPAIGGGTSTGAPAFDQRGQPRSGHVDIGAFQSQGFTIMPVGNNAQSTPVNEPFSKPLVFTVTANNPVEPVDGGIVRFAVTPVGGASATLSAATATIAGGVASVTATANTTMGQYVASATATGADPDGFVLTNTERPSLVVTTNLDEMDDTDGLTSLREAIAYAETLPGPSTITFDPAFFGTKRRTIRLTGGPLVLTDPATITIVGPGARRLTISGGGKSGVFDVEGGSLALSGLTIANGNADLGGGLRNEGGRLVLTNVLIQGNRAIVGGGLFNDGRTTLRAVSIKGNRAHVGPGLFNTRWARLLWRRLPAPSRGTAWVDHTEREEPA